MALYPTLRISKWICSEEEEIKNRDFTTFLRKQSPVHDKGRKTSADYLDFDTGELVVRKRFNDVYVEHYDPADPAILIRNQLVGIDITIEWFDDTDTALLSKTFNKPLNMVEAADVIRKRRIDSINYLKAAGKGTPVEDAQQAIFDHYESYIYNWYDMGGDGLYQAVSNETDSAILGYLAIETQPGWTVKDGILYQIDHPWDV